MRTILNKAVAHLAEKEMFNWIRDRSYLKLIYWARLGKKLHLDPPQTFNEKLQWLKLYDRKPEHTMMVDKYEVKKYISEIIGEEYVIPTLGVWERFDDIDFGALPEQFVLKCTHDSGGLVICKNKSDLDITAAKNKIEQCFKKNYYYHAREWPYKNVNKRIIAEKYMCSDDSSELTDYKIMCFNGKVKCIFTCTDRYSEDGLKVTFFDRNWERMPFERHYPADPKYIAPPQSLKQMIELSEKIANNLLFARVDFYEIGGKPYFGEITFFPGSGMEEFTPDEWDLKLGNWILLPEGKE